MTEYCDRHYKIESDMEKAGADKVSCKVDKEKIWEALDNKVSMKWLFVMIPILMTWISFQVVIYDSLKNLETKVAVIEQQLRTK